MEAARQILLSLSVIDGAGVDCSSLLSATQAAGLIASPCILEYARTTVGGRMGKQLEYL